LDRQRIDKWLWHARVVRTRSAAASLVTSGLVRMNGARITAPSQLVRPGDVATIALDKQVRLLKVTGFAERRGDAEAARVLFEDITPPPPPPDASPKVAAREPGSGRPTKRDRRATDRLFGDED
jgi:ribosome-associated heat shock protein Hsp15